MRILVGCEESQAVAIEFRKKGHEAFSCDLQDCSGGHPEWHLKMDIFDAIDLFEWDMGIFFPDCTHLAVSGAKHFDKKRKDGRQRKAIIFFMGLYYCDIPLIAIENPVGIISGEYLPKHFPDLAQKYSLPLKSNQRIQPYEHGDEAQKTTCLWLKGLPKITPTKIVDKGEMHTTPSGKTLPKWYSNCGNRKINRSKTFPGIAKVFATQWG